MNGLDKDMELPSPDKDTEEKLRAEALATPACSDALVLGMPVVIDPSRYCLRLNMISLTGEVQFKKLAKEKPFLIVSSQGGKGGVSSIS